MNIQFYIQRRPLFVGLLVLCLIEIAACGYALFFLKAHGYLPMPFLFDKSDSFMDLFHPMFWADQQGRYTAWHSVYPPLAFLCLHVVRWAMLGNQVFISAFDLRAHAVNVQMAWAACYLLIPATVVMRNYWRHFTISERAVIYVLAVFSAPMLFTFERGNLILFSLAALPFLFSSRPWIRAMAMALLVNWKPYFVLLLFAYAATRRWKELSITLVLTGSFYLATSLLLGSNPLDLPRDIFSFSQTRYPFSPREVLGMPATISAWTYVIHSPAFALRQIPFMDAWAYVANLLDGLRWGALGLVGLVLTCRSKTMSFEQAIVLLLIAIPNSGVSVGGYTMVFYLVLVPFLCSMRTAKFSMPLLLLLALPLDLIEVQRDAGSFTQFSYLGGRTVQVAGQIGLGSVARPFLDYILLLLVLWELWHFNRTKTPELSC